jgi:hypothetical protein
MYKIKDKKRIKKKKELVNILIKIKDLSHVEQFFLKKNTKQ